MQSHPMQSTTSAAAPTGSGAGASTMTPPQPHRPLPPAGSAGPPAAAATAATAARDNGDSYYVKTFGEDAKNDFAPATYEASYGHVRKWIEASLDVFKPQLKEILFPFFTHIYLDLVAKNYVAEAKAFLDTYKHDHVAFYSHDLFQLEAVQTPQHVLENAYTQAVRDPNNKCHVVQLHDTTFRLLVSYLEDNKMVALLRILSQYIHIDVASSSKPSAAMGSSSSKQGGGADKSAGTAASTATSLAQFNSTPLRLGPPLLPTTDRQLIESALTSAAAADPAVPADNKQLYVQLFNTHVRPPTAHKDDHHTPTKPVPLPPLRPKHVQEYVELVQDIAHRAHLSSTALPSIAMYTWHNTYDALTCATVSADATLAAAGFADSVIRVHSLTREPLRAVVAPPAHISSDTIRQEWTLDQLEGLREPVGDPCKRLVGHQGAVYAVKISPLDKRYLLSGSEDSTARLWSLDTFDNVACYRGHNYPVWDVDIGPEGHYFATASHDRTARLWSPEYIFPLRIFAGHLSDVDVVQFHPNSNYIATGSSDKTVRLWDVQTGNHVRVLTGHAGAVQALAFSPDGKQLAVAGEDKHVHVWDLGEGKRIKKMGSPETPGAPSSGKSVVTSLVWSQEGSLLVSGSVDGSVRVWDVLRKDAGDEAVATNVGADHAAAEGQPPVKKKRKTKATSNDLLETFWTLRTPVTGLVFTRRNLLLATGAYNPTLP